MIREGPVSILSTCGSWIIPLSCTVLLVVPLVVLMTCPAELDDRFSVFPNNSHTQLSVTFSAGFIRNRSGSHPQKVEEWCAPGA